jgi:hypothetical protein
MKYLKTYHIFENRGSGNASFDWLKKHNNENYLQLIDILQGEIFDDSNITHKTGETFEMGYDGEGYPYHKFWTFRTNGIDTSDFNSIEDKEIESIIIYNIKNNEKEDFLSNLEYCKFRFESQTGNKKKLLIEEEPYGGIEAFVSPENPGIYDYIIKIV